jgi:hypothetical protein
MKVLAFGVRLTPKLLKYIDFMKIDQPKLTERVKKWAV